ncbi:DUF3179 domain-containing protein [Vibrio sonorensis]|uniref:DUF3179 domain-containing protein n=1 Tax=Vibrio sonorensis TaxID=1004316 RepID=UPI0008DA0B4E|nr:DUF3179 domain-containing protein [Vibrio sonorensis]
MIRLTILLLGLLVHVASSNGKTLNGFDLNNALVDSDLILAGGPPKDGIPAIDNPKFTSADKVTYLHDDDVVMGVTINGVSKAYPLRILIWHEIVNDEFQDKTVVITYCPLCGTGMVFDGEVNGTKRTFGVSGLLYQSDVLMYDRQTESLWSQLGLKSVSGKEKGARLNWLPSHQMTWKAWKENYPQSLVLSLDTGFNRNYFANAYYSYFQSDSPMFPVPSNRNELPAKSWVLGVLIDDRAKAYQISGLDQALSLEDQVQGKRIKVSFDPKTRMPLVVTENGEIVPSVMVFWFAWQAFYPSTELWQLN